ncbi:calcineurin-like phosphoesterase family protein [Micromonospora pisi]|uniref:Calcineurin-like phosphoesterase family protein n=1 Tax=Micromonospora pisi TaxID=589240 RepID=A0A495JRC7_9ACTN|nr:calcineurin-like phosphoesterase family protein [Micromonospora pisi]
MLRLIGRSPRPVLHGCRRALTSVAARRTGLALSIVLVALAGVVGGVLIAGRMHVDIGPFRAEMAITPTVSGGTSVDIPPLGSLQIDSHAGPAHLSIQLGSLDLRRTEQLIDDPAGIARASQTAVTDVTSGVVRVGLRTVAVAVLGTLILAILVFRNTRRVAWAGGLALLISGGSLGIAALSLRPEAVEEPRYEGLLVNAPAVVGDARRIASDYGKYADQVQRLVGNVSKLYTTVSALPVFEPAQGTTRVLHVSDIHLNPTGWQVIRTVVEQFDIDVVIDTGDITDWGSEPEASFLGSIGVLKVPYVFIRGNHDSAATAAAVARQPNAIVLDNTVRTVAGLTIAGIGDPRFTPDKETSPNGSGATPQVIEQVTGAGEKLASTVRAAKPPVDIALVHDPASGQALNGTCPLVLAGHVHHREIDPLSPLPGQPPTLMLVQGSTGGAGLRGLEGEKPLPLALSVLYFDQQRMLQAYDDIQVGGTGQAQVSLERHLVQPPQPTPTTSATPTPGSTIPGPSLPGTPPPVIPPTPPPPPTPTR